MDLTPTVPEGRLVVESYGPGRFKVAGETIEGAIVVCPDQVVGWDTPTFDDLTPDCLDRVLALKEQPDVVLLGCGDRMQLVPAALRAEWRARGLIVEPMATGAACRTYNVLLSEGRRVAAALIPV